jgi:hypothetical protein
MKQNEMITSQITETSFVQTNTKATIHLGSDAAASYYFSDEPKTPAVYMAKKKLEKQRLSKGQSFISESGLTVGEENQDPNQSFNDVQDTTSFNNSSFLDRIQSNRMDCEDLSDEDTACLLADATTDTSCLSSKGIDEDETLNKSVLSDTTELKASIFVFSAESRQRLMDERSLAKRKEVNNHSQKLESENKIDTIHDDTLELITGVVEEKEVEKKEGATYDTERAMDDTASISDVLQILRMTAEGNEVTELLPSRHTAETYELLQAAGPSVDSRRTDTMDHLISDDTSELLNWKNFVGSPSLTAVHFGEETIGGKEDLHTMELFERASRGGLNYLSSATIPLSMDTPESQRSFRDKAESIRSLTASLKKANYRHVGTKERRLSRLSLTVPVPDSPLVDVLNRNRPSVSKTVASSPSLDSSYSKVSTAIGPNVDNVRASSTVNDLNGSGGKRKLLSPQGLPDKSQSSFETKKLCTDFLHDSTMSSDTSLLVSPLRDNLDTFELIDHCHAKTTDKDETASTGEINHIVGDLVSNVDANCEDGAYVSSSINQAIETNSDTIELKSFLARFDDDSSQSNRSLRIDLDTTGFSTNSYSDMDVQHSDSFTTDNRLNCSAMRVDKTLGLPGNSDYDTCSPPSDRVMSTSKLTTPKSILNSSRRGSNRFLSASSVTKKSVVFGSPEYAQFNIGSPSTNLTPLLPRERSILQVIAEDVNASSPDMSGDDKTSELEPNLSDLLVGMEKSGTLKIAHQCDNHNMGIRSGSIDFYSKLTQSDSSTTIELESDMNTFLVAAGKGMAVMTATAVDQTVEIDSNMDQVLNAYASEWTSHESKVSTSHSTHIDNHRLSTMSISLEESFSIDMDSRRESYEYLESLLSSQPLNRPPSRRVSLAPRTSLSFLSPCSIEADSGSNVNGFLEQEKNSHLIPEHLSALEKVICDLSWREIVSTTNIFGCHTLMQRDFEDIFLRQFDFALSNSQCPFILEELQGFLNDACDTMERYAEGETVDGESMIQVMIQGDETNMLSLQRSIRNDDFERNPILNKLISLSELAKLIVSTEVRHWEAKVTEALVLSLTKLLQEIDDEHSQIHRRIKLADDVNYSLSLFSGQQMRRARRKSISRRKVIRIPFFVVAWMTLTDTLLAYIRYLLNQYKTKLLNLKNILRVN